MLRRWPEWAQTLFFAGAALFLNLVIGFMILPLDFTDAEDFKNQIKQEQGVIAGLLVVVIAGPMMETAVGQFLPLFFAKIVRRKRTTQLLWASIWFAALHVANGPAHVIQTFFVGWIFAVCFLFCWSESWFKAVRVTYIAHALHNAVVFILFLVSTA